MARGKGRPPSVFDAKPKEGILDITPGSALRTGGLALALLLAAAPSAAQEEAATEAAGAA